MTEPLPNLNVKVTGDSSDGVAAIEEVIAAEEQLGKTSDKTNEKIKTNSKESSKAADDFSKAVQKSNKDGESSYTALGKAIDSEKAKLKDLQAQFKAGGGADVFGDIKQSESDLASLTSMAKSAGVEIGNATNSVTGMLAASAHDGESAAATLGRAIDAVRSHIDALQKQTKTSGTSTSIFGDLTKAKADLKELTSLGESAGMKFAADGAVAGEGFAANFGQAITKILPEALSNPAVAAPLIGVAIAAAPGIAATIGGAVAAGFGLGVIGVGALSLKNDPAITSALSGLKSDVASTFTDAAAPLVGPLSGGLGELDKTVKSIKSDLSDMFASAAGPATQLFDGISGFVRDAAPKFAQAMADAAPAVDELAQDLPQFGSALAQSIDLMASGSGNAQALDDVFKALDFTVLAVGESIHWLSDAYEFMRNPGAEIASLMGDDVKPKMTGVKDAADELTRSIITGGSGFANFITDVDGTTAALNDLITATQTWEQLAQSNDDTLLAMDKAQTTFNKDLKTGAKNWDESTVAGQKQVANLNTLNEAITAHFDSVAKGGPLTEKQTAAELKATQQLLDQAKAAGATSAETATLTGEVSRLKDQLALIKSKTIQIKEEIAYNEHFTATYSTGAIRPGFKDTASAGANSGVMSYANSGIKSYANSGDITGIYPGMVQPAYRFAEKSTVNEAVIAQHGDDNRAISTLRTAAVWHDKDLVDRGSHPQASGDVYITNVVTLNGKELSRQLIGPVQRTNSRSSASIYGAQ